MSFLYPSTRTRRIITYYAQVVQTVAIIIGGTVALWWYGKQLEAPYDEKQLNLYIEAGKVAADLAKLPRGPGLERAKAEQRFWELYWGELPFVESHYAVRGELSIEARMVRLCEAIFDKKECQPRTAVSLEACAIRLSILASNEIQEHWKPWQPLVGWLVNTSNAAEPCPASEPAATTSKLPLEPASSPRSTPPAVPASSMPESKLP
jgi:hypothetical protein